MMMINNFTLRLIFCCFILTSCNICDAQKLHLILVADNRDPEIGNPSGVSLSFYERIAQNVENATKLQVVTHKIMSDNLSKDYILNRINTLSVADKDVVFFYSSTHGWNDNTSEYPMLVLQAGVEASRENSINLKTIYDLLMQKKARLTIVFGEACNELKSARPKAGPSRTATHPLTEMNTEYIKDLFLRSKMSILVCSSRKGQFSFSDKEEGGRFTQAFYNIFQNYTSNNYRREAPTWQKIMEDVKNKTNQMSQEISRKDQEPYYEITQLTNVEVVPRAVVTDKIVNPAGKKTGTTPSISMNQKPSFSQGFVTQASPTTPITAARQTQPSTKQACFNTTTFQTIRTYHRFVETYWKSIDNADLDDARETFSTQIFTEDYKELYSNLSEKLGVESFKNEATELNKLGLSILDILEETNVQLESEQFKLKVSAKLSLVVTDLNRAIKKVESIKRICSERE
jgi:Caspase domain